MAVKVVITRKIKKLQESELIPLLLKLRNLAVSQPGYISGESLVNVERPEDHLVISTWQSVEHWNKWIASKERKKIQNKIDELLGYPTDYNVYQYS